MSAEERQLRIEALTECVRAARERFGAQSPEYRDALIAWKREVISEPSKPLAIYRRAR